MSLIAGLGESACLITTTAWTIFTPCCSEDPYRERRMTERLFPWMATPGDLASSRDRAVLQRRQGLALASRRPRKISVTVPQAVYETLLQHSEDQGRSLSSLASYWLQVQASRAQELPQQHLPCTLAQTTPAFGRNGRP